MKICEEAADSEAFALQIFIFLDLCGFYLIPEKLYIYGTFRAQGSKIVFPAFTANKLQRLELTFYFTRKPFYKTFTSIRSGQTSTFMDLQKAKIILEKINALHKSMSADARNISVIEKDLMRNYVLQLYECMLDMPASVKTAETPAVEIIKSPSITLRKQEPMVEEVVPAPKPVVRRPIVAEEEDDEYVPVISKVTAKASEISSTRSSANENFPELEDLFNLTSGKDLADKLSSLPISDIKKAMGVNERIFTMNELFGGDQVVFDRALNSLNSFSNFDEAKNYLIQQVASKYSWTEKERKSKARNFVKLVKRRYS